MNTPSQLFCAACGVQLWRDPDKALIHDPPADHTPIPTANPKDITVSIPGTDRDGGFVPVAEVIERIVEQRVPPKMRLCATCLSVFVLSIKTECHGCAGRTAGPMTVEWLEAHGLAAHT